MSHKLSFIWDYDIDEDKLRDILSGKVTTGKLDKRWALLRLFEYAPYKEIVRLLGYREIVEQWPEVRNRIRSQSRKRGFDFLVERLKNKYPEKIR
ncbi:MAG: hypothetical protein IT392_10030 [Nitrospirae bacterium]|nr:hypothetical protein [Nitrospirota bacterium]